MCINFQDWIDFELSERLEFYLQNLILHFYTPYGVLGFAQKDEFERDRSAYFKTKEFASFHLKLKSSVK